MSGYLEVKYPFKANLGLNPFKSWKRQWCILRPSPTFSGGILAVYCSEAGASAGTIELPAGFVVRRAKSSTRPHAFAVFPTDDPRKPRVLLAATTYHDAQLWMEKIRALIDGNKLMGSEVSIKESFSVTVTATELSRKCNLNGTDSTVSLTSKGVCVSHTHKQVSLLYQHITDVTLNEENGGNGTCILSVNSGFIHGAGELCFSSPLAVELTAALQCALGLTLAPKHLSKSDGHLHKKQCCDMQQGKVRRTSCHSGPSDVVLDDLDLVMSKECKQASSRRLSRCSAEGHLAEPVQPEAVQSHASLDDSMCERASLMSVGSGIYEEIPEPGAEPDYCRMTRDTHALQLCGVSTRLFMEEPTYESVAECVYGTMRRTRTAPPPLPPPRDMYSSGLAGSLGRLPAEPARTLPRWDRSRHAFSAFRKRLKSDSRISGSPKSDAPKDKHVDTKKKKFDFPPTRDLFKSFKVSKKMKNLKISPGNLSKGETKSCEFLDESEHVETSRCSKSVECLESDEFLDEINLSMEYDEHRMAALALPQEIVDLILKGHETFNKICSTEQIEGDYLPMSPIVPPPIEHHYIAMSPRAHIASSQ